MTRRTLGRTGLEVSAIGLGGIKFGSMSQDEVTALVRAAVERGVNLIDTARGYGESEDRIGRALGGRREGIILSSKSPACEAAEMRRDLERSLRALRTDCIDIYKVHNLRFPDDYDRATGPGGSVEALEKAREEGLVRFIGLSCHRYQQTLERAIRSGRFDVAMVAYNVLNDELMDERVLPLASEHNVGTLIMKPLAGGVLAESPTSVRFEASLEGGDRITAADAIAFVLANQHVDCAVVGMTSVDELEQDVAAVARTADLGAQKTEALREAAEALGREFCRSCGYCLPCPNGILIPVILRHLFYFNQYGLDEWARGRYKMVEVKADNCTGCEECMERCPYELRIPELLEEAHRKLS